MADDNPGEGLTHSSVPVPDPTVLTMRLTEREIKALRELLVEQIQGNKTVIETRLTEMDKAIVLVREEHQRLVEVVPRSMDEKIRAAIAVVSEQLRSIQTQFTERDIRTEQTSRDSKVAVDAALQAAKEAVNAQQIANSLSIDKSERQVGEQIKQINITIESRFKATDDKVEDLKERQNRAEGSGLGKSQQLATAIAVGGLALAVIAFFIGKVAF